ncbi:hypothetical protein H072_2757 [Dactylellina haptotyla CBS 200.50]|uniref:Uncharacterized protein n=1 Tax=Dactylellina haptotyla (strain CBS 200.50) TaxID=1284197 RepID=S8AJX4_DACHA|nr:hypothetical protein H072_2757 [Dactylellina haptotyla CBS 200.50]
MKFNPSIIIYYLGVALEFYQATLNRVRPIAAKMDRDLFFLLFIIYAYFAIILPLVPLWGALVSLLAKVFVLIGSLAGMVHGCPPLSGSIGTPSGATATSTCLDTSPSVNPYVRPANPTPDARPTKRVRTGRSPSSGSMWCPSSPLAPMSQPRGSVYTQSYRYIGKPIPFRYNNAVVKTPENLTDLVRDSSPEPPNTGVKSRYASTWTTGFWNDGNLTILSPR